MLPTAILGYAQTDPNLGFVGRTESYNFGDEGVAPRFNIAHRPSDNLMLYATYSEVLDPVGLIEQLATLLNWFQIPIRLIY